MAEELPFEFVIVEITDTYGISRVLFTSVEYYEKNKTSGIPVDIVSSTCLLPNSTFELRPGSFGEKGFPNGYAYPDEKTLKIHHLQKDTAVVFAEFRCEPNNITSDHVASCSRGVLAKALDRLKGLNLSIYGAFEYEFYLYKMQSNRLTSTVYDRPSLMKSTVTKDYSSFIKDVMRVMKKYGIQPEYNQLEYGPGQFEITMTPAYGTDIADNAMRFKELVKEVAKQHGYHASFASMPRPGTCSSSSHLNHSIWGNNEEVNVFFDTNQEDNLSHFSKHWLAGLQHHVRALTSLSAASINCYDRLKQDYTPKNDSWGFGNRFATFRVKNFDEKRTYIENRISGAGTNPYLALAVLIYAGIDGVEKKLNLKNSFCEGDPTNASNSKDSGRFTNLPRDMREGIGALLQDEVICENIGKQYIDCFIHLREDELKQYDKKSEKNDANNIRNYVEFF